jgi:GNAT superfamily N-acetyltransferase
MTQSRQTNFIIRKAKLSDVGELSELYLGLSHSSKRSFHPFPFEYWKVRSIFLIMVLSGILIGLLKKPIPRLGFLLLVGEDTVFNRIDGFTYFSTNARLPEGTLVANRGIVTRDGIRSKGLGTALDTELIRIAKQVGIHKFSVTALKDNDASLALHRKMGYQIRGPTHDLWNDEVQDAVILELDLDSC